MSIQIEGAYFKMDLAIIKVKSVLLVLHQSGYFLIKALLFANKHSVYICPNYRNVHKISCRQCENLFLSGSDVNLLEGRIVEN